MLLHCFIRCMQVFNPPEISIIRNLRQVWMVGPLQSWWLDSAHFCICNWWVVASIYLSRFITRTSLRLRTCIPCPAINAIGRSWNLFQCCSSIWHFVVKFIIFQSSLFFLGKRIFRPLIWMLAWLRLMWITTIGSSGGFMPYLTIRIWFPWLHLIWCGWVLSRRPRAQCRLVWLCF